jgi:hypothetical protein
MPFRWLLVLVLAATSVGCGGKESSSSQPDASMTDARPVDAARLDAFSPGITCGASTCALTQNCCETSPGTLVCQDPSVGCIGTHARCDGPEDCAGETCCAGPGGAGDSLRCASSCGTVVVCHTTLDCPQGTSCQLYEDGWSFCLPIPDAGVVDAT